MIGKTGYMVINFWIQAENDENLEIASQITKSLNFQITD